MTENFTPAKAGTQRPRLSKEEYAEKKRAEKDGVYQLADEAAKEIVSSPEKFKAFLDTQSRLDRYSAVNALLIYKQYPQAVQLKDFDDWSKDNIKITKGAKSISILEPVEYAKRNGTTGISYNVKKVFDVAQTNGKRPPAPTVNRDPKALITTMLDSSPVNVEATNELPYPNMAAFYNNEEQTLYVKRDVGDSVAVAQCVAQELGHAQLSINSDSYSRSDMDECWLDITGTGSLFGSPVEVANKIRETIKFELGLTISVGVSFNKIFAKLGSDMKKPDAVTVIPKDTFREKIWKLPAADLLGVGRATQRTLDSYGIRTIGALAQTDPEFLRSVLGKNGVALWNYANGNDLSLVAKEDFVSPIKSVGHGITTVADLEKPEQVWPVFLELTQDIGHKLRVHGLSAEGVAIHIRDNTLCTRQWQTKIDLPTQSPMVLAKRAFQLFEARYGWYNPIRSVTIQAINLIPQDTPRQIGLFMDVEKQEKLERLEKCIETIRRRFGKDSIRNGVLYQDLQLPPEKVEITMPTGMVG